MKRTADERREGLILNRETHAALVRAGVAHPIDLDNPGAYLLASGWECTNDKDAGRFSEWWISEWFHSDRDCAVGRQQHTDALRFLVARGWTAHGKFEVRDNVRGRYTRSLPSAVLHQLARDQIARYAGAES